MTKENHRRAKLLIAGLVCLIVFGCVLGIGSAFCAATLHVRRWTGPEPPHASKVRIAARDNATLTAWWMEPVRADGACVIVLHGIGDSKSSSSGFAPLFLVHGYSVLAPDSRAHGESGGEFVTYGLLEKYDVIEWAHWMQTRGCKKIYGLGESLGASILIQAVAVEPIFNAIVAECPYADLRTMAEGRMRQMLRLPSFVSRPLAYAVVQAGLLYARLVDGLDFRQVSPLHSLLVSSTPVLLIHGLDDRRTPPSQSQKLAAIRPATTRLWLVPHAGHTNASAVAPSEFRDRVLGWFAAN